MWHRNTKIYHAWRCTDSSITIYRRNTSLRLGLWPLVLLAPPRPPLPAQLPSVLRLPVRLHRLQQPRYGLTWKMDTRNMKFVADHARCDRLLLPCLPASVPVLRVCVRGLPPTLSMYVMGMAGLSPKAADADHTMCI